jgi:hypothetical protein
MWSALNLDGAKSSYFGGTPIPADCLRVGGIFLGDHRDQFVAGVVENDAMSSIAVSRPQALCHM